MAKGSYCIILKVREPLKIRIGSLGKIAFEKGDYVYVGSALNNLEARINRHFAKRKKIFWHIDYLTAHKGVSVEEAYCKISKKKEECEIAKVFLKNGKPIKGFGCSDCGCESHLFIIEKQKNKKILENCFKMR